MLIQPPKTRAALLVPRTIEPPKDKRGRIVHIKRDDVLTQEAGWTFDNIPLFKQDIVHMDHKDGTLTIRRDGDTLVHAPTGKQMIQQAPKITALSKQRDYWEKYRARIAGSVKPFSSVNALKDWGFVRNQAQSKLKGPIREKI
jgi:hypothetical protein